MIKIARLSTPLTEPEERQRLEDEIEDSISLYAVSFEFIEFIVGKILERPQRKQLAAKRENEDRVCGIKLEKRFGEAISLIELEHLNNPSN